MGRDGGGEMVDFCDFSGTKYVFFFAGFHFFLEDLMLVIYIMSIFCMNSIVCVSENRVFT